MNINEKDLETLKIINKALDDKFAFDIKILDIRDSSSIGDFFIIASANNISQANAMADSVEEQLGKAGIQIKSREGKGSNGWILLDFYNFIVHVFNKEDREFYTLDKAWQNAPEINL